MVDAADRCQPEHPSRPADWQFGSGTPYTVQVPLSREDRPVIVIATISIIVAGLFVAAVLLLTTGGGGGPKRYSPFQAGALRSIRSNLADQGPFYVPDPYGGDRSILFALEHGKVVALSTLVPDTKDCRVTIKDEGKEFVDCHGDRLKTTELDRYLTTVRPSGDGTELLYVDLRNKLPAPDLAGSAPAPS